MNYNIFTYNYFPNYTAKFTFLVLLKELNIYSKSLENFVCIQFTLKLEGCIFFQR